MTAEQPLYGLMAEFDTPEEILAAARRAYEEGYRRMDAYTPFPVEGLSEAIGVRRDALSAIVLLGGLTGATAGFFMQYFATVINYPWNVGGRPHNSWPAYIPITFEFTILAAAFAAVIGMLVLNRLPMPYHPVFNAPHFELATYDRFFFCIQANDPKFDREATAQFLANLHPREVTEVSP